MCSLVTLTYIVHNTVRSKLACSMGKGSAEARRTYGYYTPKKSPRQRKNSNDCGVLVARCLEIDLFSSQKMMDHPHIKNSTSALGNTMCTDMRIRFAADLITGRVFYTSSIAAKGAWPAPVPAEVTTNYCLLKVNVVLIRLF